MVGAREEAAALRHNYIGTEHLLLGLLAVPESSSARVLNALGVTADSVRDQVKRIIGSGDETPPEQIPFTPRAKKVLELGLREALSLGHNYVGTEHLLLGLAREGEGVAARILLDADLDSDAIRVEIQAFLGSGGGESSSPRPGQVRPRADKWPVATAEKPTEEEEGEEEDAKEESEEGIEAVPTHHDRPATEDELGRARLAGVLGERIRRVRGEKTEGHIRNRRERRQKLAEDRDAARQAGSFMVHVHAPWGAGKSSLLNFLAADLRNRLKGLALRPRRPRDGNLSQWLVVEFSAWEHQRLVAPWWWLLAAIHRSCARELWQVNRGRWFWFLIRDLAWRLWNARAAVVALTVFTTVFAVALATDWFGLKDESLTTVNTITLTAAAGTTLAVTVAGLVRGVSRWLAVDSADGAVRYLKKAHDPLGVYRRRFRWLIRSGGRPVAVFIDDLDRCKADYVVELLEGMQTLFAGEPVTYVIAADREWLCESFAKTYSDFEESVGEPGRPLGFLFLEKTFQISQKIPTMSEDQRSRYWTMLMRPRPNGTHSRKPRRADLGEAFAGATTQSDVEQGVQDLVNQGVDDDQALQAAVRRLNAPDMEQQLERLLSEFVPLLENNPRSMKRLMNAYGLERDRLLRDGYLLSKAERRQLALLTILDLRWPLFAECLRNRPEEAKFCLTGEAPADHPHRALFSDPCVRRLFDGSKVEERLSQDILREFPLRPPQHAA